MWSTMTASTSRSSSTVSQYDLYEQQLDSPYVYLTRSGVEALKRFQYRGQDKSLIYQHVLSPLAQFCVDRFVPPWMAPNTITLSGACLMVSSYILLAWYCPTFDSSAPGWIFAYSATCMLIYQTLDNMDGKQARKTASSSPLGLLFDHGCDAFNCVIGITTWACAMGLETSSTQDSRILALLTISAYTPFYMATWEEFHTGALILPIFNGVTEGLLLGAALIFSSAIFGPQLWHHGTHWYDSYGFKYLLNIHPAFTNICQCLTLHDPSQASWRNCECLMILTYLLLAQETILKLYTVIKDHGALLPLKRLVPFVTAVLCFLFIGKSSSIWHNQPRTSLLLSSMLFVEMATALMLHHMTLSEFRISDRWVLLPLIIMTVMLYLHPSISTLLESFVPLYLTAMVVYLSMKITRVITEISHALNIYCFDITTSRYAQPCIINGKKQN